MDTITVQCPAKVNLTLDILGKRPDGYHLMEMVMQTVSLCDTLTLKRGAETGGIHFRTDAKLPEGGENLAVQAADAFLRKNGLPGAGLQITLEKRIPSAAGLGGGSADAAGVLYGLNILYATGCPLSMLCEIGLEVGADVPFCLTGGTALVEGIGEKITPLPPLPDCFFVIAKPAVSSGTASAFRRFDEAPSVSRPDTRGMIAALKGGTLSAVSDKAANVFEEALSLPGVAELEEILLGSGALTARLSGSGSAVFGIFKHRAQAESCKEKIQETGLNAFVCRPLKMGPFLEGRIKTE